MAAVLVLACAEDRGAAVASDPAAVTTDPSSAQAVAGSTDTGALTSVGSLSCRVDGRPKQFDHLPDRDNRYLPLASTVKAFSAAGGTARASVTINFLSLDLRKIDYPSELPRPKNLGQPMDPLAAMATVGFIYVDQDGQEWAGPGRIRVESFAADGTLKGTFDFVTMPHVDQAGKKVPPVTLTGGRFEVRLSGRWG